MISAGDFRNGVTVEYDGGLFTIIEFQHVKPGKGAAFVRTKLRNIITGSIVEQTFRPQEKMARAHIERRDMQYLYKDGNLCHFMDTDSFEQITVDTKNLGDSLRFVKENEVIKILSHNGNVFDIELPVIVELKVVETEPGFTGNATNVVKPATLETGAIINVQPFVNEGDIIKIDTRTGEYAGRVQN